MEGKKNEKWKDIDLESFQRKFCGKKLGKKRNFGSWERKCCFFQGGHTRMTMVSGHCL